MINLTTLSMQGLLEAYVMAMDDNAERDRIVAEFMRRENERAALAAERDALRAERAETARKVMLLLDAELRDIEARITTPQYPKAYQDGRSRSVMNLMGTLREFFGFTMAEASRGYRRDAPEDDDLLIPATFRPAPPIGSEVPDNEPSARPDGTDDAPDSEAPR